MRVMVGWGQTAIFQRRAIRMICVALVGLLLAACGSSPTSSAKPTSIIPVKLSTDVFFYGSDAPFFVGVEQGIYRKYGLDVSITPGTGSGTVAELVANGTFDFGFVDGGVLAQSVSKGLSEEMILGILESNPMIIISRPQTGITAPKDLDGKTGGFAAGSSPELLFPAFAAKTGVDLASIKKLQVDIPTRDTLFVEGQTQFTFGYTVVQLPELEARCGCTLSVLKYSSYGINPLSNGVIVSKAYAKAHPDVVRRFAQATQSAIAFAVGHPAQAVNDFYKYAGTKGQLSRSIVTEQWANTIPLLHTPATKGDAYGCMAPTDWSNSIALLVKYENMTPIKPSSVYTNQYLVGKC
jgi:NitT/TauT family transport system substrate-binding protein